MNGDSGSQWGIFGSCVSRTALRSAVTFAWQLNDMELEVRGFAAATRRALGNKVRSYKVRLKSPGIVSSQIALPCTLTGCRWPLFSLQESLDGVQSDLSRVKDRHDRESLFSGGSQPLDYNEQSLSQRERLMQTTERMQGTTSRLEEGRRTLAETEDVGALPRFCCYSPCWCVRGLYKAGIVSFHFIAQRWELHRS